jgi:hypothetical protein
MIEATQKKLRETQFFLWQLLSESKQIFRNEPEALQFYLNAFPSTARSVMWALQWEEPSLRSRPLTGETLRQWSTRASTWHGPYGR